MYSKVGNSSDKWAMIINPYASRNRQYKYHQKLIAELKKQAFDFSIYYTQFPKHILQLLPNLIQKGYRQFIISGGDGTFSEAINATFKQNIIPPLHLTFAFMPSGTGNDWARTIKLPKNTKKLINTITKGYTINQDIGKITYLNKQQEKVEHFFLNVTGVGFDTYVSKKYLSTTKNNGAFSYLWATLRGLLSYESKYFTIEYLNAQNKWCGIAGNMFEIAFGIGQYFGGGLKICPNAILTDGLIDITCIKDIGKMECFTQLPRLKTGNFSGFSKIETALASTIKVRSNVSTELIQADGELIGCLPATIQLVSKAVKIIVPKNIY